MRKLFTTALLFTAFLPLSCEKQTGEPFSLASELQEGAWRFQKVVNEQDEIIIDGTGEPTMLFFFLEDMRLRGRLAGNYTLSNDSLSFQASIVDSVRVLFGEYEKLTDFPQRYYDLSDIMQGSTSGTVEYIENGWDSEFSFQYAPNRVMWFERY